MNYGLGGLAEGAIETHGGADQRKMGKSLRVVAESLAAWSRLLGIEAEMVGKAKHPFEHQARLFQSSPVEATGAGERIDEPEGTNVEGALLAAKPVGGLLDIVAIDEAVGDKPALLRRLQDRVQKADRPRVDGRQKKGEDQHQVCRVKGVATIVLDESAQLFVPPLAHDFAIDRVPYAGPTRPVGRERSLLGNS